MSRRGVIELAMQGFQFAEKKLETDLTNTQVASEIPSGQRSEHSQTAQTFHRRTPQKGKLPTILFEWVEDSSHVSLLGVFILPSVHSLLSYV